MARPHRHHGVAPDAFRLLARFDRAAQRTRRRRAVGPRDTDPDAVHDVRVAARRLTAALRTWRPLLHGKPRRSAQERLRDVRRTLGPVREAEVHAAALAARVAALPGLARTALRPLAAVLWRHVRRLRRDTQQAVARRQVLRIDRDVRAAFHGARPDAAMLERARARLTRGVARTRAALRAAAAPGATGELRHDARIAVKKLRYAIDAWTRVTGEDSGWPQGLAALQRDLGDANDAAGLIAVIRRLTRGDRPRATAARPLLLALARDRDQALAQFLARTGDTAWLSSRTPSRASPRAASAPAPSARRRSRPAPAPPTVPSSSPRTPAAPAPRAARSRA